MDKELTESIKKNKNILRQLTNLNNEVKDLKSRVRGLELKNSYYPTKEEIRDIKIGGTDPY